MTIPFHEAVEVQNALALTILREKFVGKDAVLNDKGTNVVKRLGRKGNIADVGFGHHGDVRVLFYVYSTLGDGIVLNTEPWTRQWRPLSHLDLME